MSWGEALWIAQNINTVKSVQRGTTAAAQTVTIAEVDMEKAFVISVSKGSAGYVAARGDITGKLDGEAVFSNVSVYEIGQTDKYANKTYVDITLSGTRTISGGTTDLTTKQYSAQLISNTQLQCDGPVEWQVIEYY